MVPAVTLLKKSLSVNDSVMYTCILVRAIQIDVQYVEKDVQSMTGASYTINGGAWIQVALWSNCSAIRKEYAAKSMELRQHLSHGHILAQGSPKTLI